MLCNPSDAYNVFFPLSEIPIYDLLSALLERCTTWPAVAQSRQKETQNERTPHNSRAKTSKAGHTKADVAWVMVT
jgi:hypothetical protein